ncbi:hypothetical protein KBTX_01225 [wastewater metagenome]|uniref:Uncharacterized protein n=2 Tax=unclassified sequences TaxID=12908 RepID=A0A5B8RDU5_9ZZZZ|nr:hypothetical protein KBTEX_01225 [uncultured organism]
MVSMLMENPVAAITAKVPSSTTGTASVGISVARQLCRNRIITSTTRAMASIRVRTTSSIEASTKGAVSKGVATSRSFGK